jgi:hypothetical protein
MVGGSSLYVCVFHGILSIYYAHENVKKFLFTKQQTQRKQTMKTWIKNHQKTASVIGLCALGAFLTGMYFLTGLIGGHYDNEE